MEQPIPSEACPVLSTKAAATYPSPMTTPATNPLTDRHLEDRLDLAENLARSRTERFRTDVLVTLGLCVLVAVAGAVIWAVFAHA